MKSQQLETQIREWFDEMMSKYPISSFKYEYSERRRVYLISTTINESDVLFDAYCEDAMRFEDHMADLYGDDAPLFTDNEVLFKLSDRASVVARYVESQEVEMPYTKLQYTTSPSWASVLGNMFHFSSKQSQVYSTTQYWGGEPQPNTYLLAA